MTKKAAKQQESQRRKKLAHRNMPKAAGRSLSARAKGNKRRAAHPRTRRGTGAAGGHQRDPRRDQTRRRRMPSRYSMRLSKVLRVSAKQCSAWSGGTMAVSFTTRQATISRPKLLDYVFKNFPKRPDRSVAAGRAILDGRIAHVPDHASRIGRTPKSAALAGNWRASLAVPMLRDGKPLGAISVGKAEAVPFSERQMQLLSTFADQAVIAIENVRLFEAEQKRTRELSEALEQQTATSEVLQLISSSPGELEPVFRGHAGERDAHLRGQVRHSRPLRWRSIP